MLKFIFPVIFILVMWNDYFRTPALPPGALMSDETYRALSVEILRPDPCEALRGSLALDSERLGDCEQAERNRSNAWFSAHH